MRNVCTLEKHLYDARSAQKEYEELRSESRSGYNLTEKELKQLNSVMSPLLKNGQSIHHILTNNPDKILRCEKTIYAYVDNGLFDGRNVDMPRKVRFRPRKKKSVELKVDKACRMGRTYDDYIKFREDHPELPVVELDSVEGIKGGAVLLTIHFVLQKFQLAYKRKANDSQSVIDIFNSLYDLLGKELYMKLFPILLADNGTEFSNPEALEFGPDGERRSWVFYCNPSAPNEKGACENNHEFIRRVIPKGKDIGKYSQEQINLMMNHINSYSRPELGNKPPYAMLAFHYGRRLLKKLGFEKIQPNDIILKPSLLRKHD
jgi:IS30 family transposase